ncbi:unnamed protein product [Amoebophrya sp. A25]|nr:unnamed protein product [Amoebophrya sp. A25]|eukprot:GSA25T00015607001.1
MDPNQFAEAARAQQMMMQQWQQEWAGMMQMNPDMATHMQGMMQNMMSMGTATGNMMASHSAANSAAVMNTGALNTVPSTSSANNRSLPTGSNRNMTGGGAVASSSSTTGQYSSPYGGKESGGKSGHASAGRRDQTVPDELPATLRKFFLGGLCFQTTSADVKRHFQSWGEVKEGTVMFDAAGNSRHFGFVNFKRHEDACRAYAARPHTIQGRTIDVKPCFRKAHEVDSEDDAGGRRRRGGGRHRARSTSRSRSRSRSADRLFEERRRAMQARDGGGQGSRANGGSRSRSSSRSRRSRSSRSRSSRSRSSRSRSGSSRRRDRPDDMRVQLRKKHAEKVEALNNLPVLCTFQEPMRDEEDEDDIDGTDISDGLHQGLDNEASLSSVVKEEEPPTALSTWREMVDAGILPAKMETALTRQGLRAPSLVQKFCLPILAAGHDLICSAQTGSGKTFAFLIPVVSKLLDLQSRDALPHRIWFDNLQQASPLVLILSPTRELAVQTHKEIKSILPLAAASETSTRRSNHGHRGAQVKDDKNRELHAVVCYGGERSKVQLDEIYKQVDILSGTPGRILDFIDCGRISLNFVDRLVLDEADMMLDLGLQSMVQDIVLKRDCQSPAHRQTLLFSATFPPGIREMCRQYLNPRKKHVFLRIGTYDHGTGGSCAHIEQQVKLASSDEEKFSMLEQDLRTYVRHNGHGAQGVQPRVPQPGVEITSGSLPGASGNPFILASGAGTVSDPGNTVEGSAGSAVHIERAIVFSNRRVEATRLAHSLSERGFRVAHIHSKLDQASREAAVDSFARGECNVLVATNIASRGLDFDVKAVFQIDLPNDITSYTHRIGRTGRLGERGGVAISYVNRRDQKLFRPLRDFLRLNGQQVPQFLERWTR